MPTTKAKSISVDCVSDLPYRAVSYGVKQITSKIGIAIPNIQSLRECATLCTATKQVGVPCLAIWFRLNRHLCQLYSVPEASSWETSNTDGGMSFYDNGCMLAPTNKPATDPGCRDYDSAYQCEIWSRDGFCGESHQFYRYMTRNCAKTCGCFAVTADKIIDGNDDDGSKDDGNKDDGDDDDDVDVDDADGYAEAGATTCSCDVCEVDRLSSEEAQFPTVSVASPAGKQSKSQASSSARTKQVVQSLTLRYTGQHCTIATNGGSVCNNQLPNQTFVAMGPPAELTFPLVATIQTRMYQLNSVGDVLTFEPQAVVSIGLTVSSNRAVVSKTVLHTHCRNAGQTRLMLGDRFGPFEVVNFFTRKGKSLCNCSTACQSAYAQFANVQPVYVQPAANDQGAVVREDQPGISEIPYSKPLYTKAGLRGGILGAALCALLMVGVVALRRRSAAKKFPKNGISEPSMSIFSSTSKMEWDDAQTEFSGFTNDSPKRKRGAMSKQGTYFVPPARAPSARDRRHSYMLKQKLLEENNKENGGSGGKKPQSVRLVLPKGGDVHIREIVSRTETEPDWDDGALTECTEFTDELSTRFVTRFHSPGSSLRMRSPQTKGEPGRSFARTPTAFNKANNKEVDNMFHAFDDIVALDGGNGHANIPNYSVLPEGSNVHIREILSRAVTELDWDDDAFEAAPSTSKFVPNNAFHKVPRLRRLDFIGENID